MPVSRADLLQFLTDKGIAHETVDHPAIFTVDEGRAFKASMPGGHSKNLFLKDKKGALFLATAWCDTRADLVGLGKVLGAKGRLSFGKPDLMTQTLGVIPGAVTPFALLNESAASLSEMIVDEALMRFDRVWFHPVENTASTAVTPQDLLKFLRLCGHEPRLTDLSAPLGQQ
ncbi:MAG: prolyl-tRNA synthetase associated domain-containing protein [Pseudomonadota bacterium]